MWSPDSVTFYDGPDESCTQEVLHHEATQALNSLFKSHMTETDLLKKFFKFILPHKWHHFKSIFRADGTLSFKEFDHWLHWEQHWDGNIHQLFEYLDIGNKGYLKLSAFVDGKRWFEHVDNVGAFDVEHLRDALESHYGNLGRAWRLCFDPEDRGGCCFNEFARRLHELGLHRTLRSCWASLTDIDPSRPLRFDDLDPCGHAIISRFVTSLCLQYGSLREGWTQIIQDGSGPCGHLRKSEFVEICDKFGIKPLQAKYIFAVLDKNRSRYLTVFHKMTFLSHFDPGNSTAENEGKPKQKNTVANQINRAVRSSRLKRPSESILVFPESPLAAPRLKEFEAFDVEIIMTRQEYSEYQHRVHVKQLMNGIDLRGEEKRKKKNQEIIAKMQEEQEAESPLSLFGYRPPKT